MSLRYSCPITLDFGTCDWNNAHAELSIQYRNSKKRTGEKPMGSDGQVTRSAAEVYDELFPPALFNEWPPHVVELAGLKPGMHVLDVACGTGVLSLAAAAAVSPDGSVTGLDLNPGRAVRVRLENP